MGSTYCHPALKQLKEQQARFAPRERRLEQIDRAEQVLSEIEDEKRYPYEYLCYRITGFRPEGAPRWCSTVVTYGTIFACSWKTCQRRSGRKPSRHPSQS